MESLLGFASLLIVSLIILILAYKRPEVFNFLIVALIIRVIVLLIGYYIVPLPDSTSDAIKFEIVTRNLAKDGFFNLLGEFDTDPFIFLVGFMLSHIHYLVKVF